MSEDKFVVLHQDLAEAAGYVLAPSLVLYDKRLSPLACRVYLATASTKNFELQDFGLSDLLGEPEARIKAAKLELEQAGLLKGGRFVSVNEAYTWDDVFRLHPHLAERYQGGA